MCVCVLVKVMREGQESSVVYGLSLEVTLKSLGGRGGGVQAS